MTPVLPERTRTCLRCKEEFTEPAGTVARLCDGCRNRSTGMDIGAHTRSVVDRSRERTCIRCSGEFVECPGEISRVCPSCDPDHVVLG